MEPSTIQLLLSCSYATEKFSLWPFKFLKLVDFQRSNGKSLFMTGKPFRLVILCLVFGLLDFEPFGLLASCTEYLVPFVSGWSLQYPPGFRSKWNFWGEPPPVVFLLTFWRLVFWLPNFWVAILHLVLRCFDFCSVDTRSNGTFLSTWYWFKRL